MTSFLFLDKGELIAPGTLTFCYDQSISTPLIIFPKLRKRDDNGELGKFVLINPI